MASSITLHTHVQGPHAHKRGATHRGPVTCVWMKTSTPHMCDRACMHMPVQETSHTHMHTRWGGLRLPARPSLWRTSSCSQSRQAPPSPISAGAGGDMGCTIFDLRSRPVFSSAPATLAPRAGVRMEALRKRPGPAPLSLLRNKHGHTGGGSLARRRAGGQSGSLPGTPLRTRLSEGQAPEPPHNPDCDIK